MALFVIRFDSAPVSLALLCTAPLFRFLARHSRRRGLCVPRSLHSKEKKLPIVICFGRAVLVLWLLVGWFCDCEMQSSVACGKRSFEPF